MIRSRRHQKIGRYLNRVVMISLVRFLIVVCLLASSTIATAKRVALLVGVQNYAAPIPSLEGSRNDVLALKDVLVSRWRFEPENVQVLMDGEATHEGIKTALAQLVSRTSEGDFVFFYFAGHGTSAENSYLRIPLPHTSGAIMPSDFKMADTQSMLEKLIIGRRDLRPALEMLDKGGRRVFVAIDACFSGDTVRGRHLTDTGRPSLPVRQFSINAASNNGQQGASDDSLDRAYPYQHVVYISAAANNEAASEVTAEYLKYYPTIDGKPHGAFSDALLRALNGELPATSGSLKFFQLHAAIRTFMEKRGYPQTPQLLPLPTTNSAWEPETAWSNVPRRNEKEIAGSTAANAPSPLLTVRMDRRATKLLEKRIARLTDVKRVKARADLTITYDAKNLSLLSPGGDILFSCGADSSDLMLQAVSQQVWIYSLIQQSSKSKGLALEFDDDELGATRLAGSDIGFRLVADTPGYLALIAIDPAGTIRVLFPDFPSEVRKTSERQPVRVSDIDVVPPFGVDVVMGFEFHEPPDWLLPFVAQDMPASDENRQKFVNLVKTRATGVPIAILQTVTSDRLR